MGKALESPAGFELMRCGGCGGSHVQLLARHGTGSENYSEIRIVCDKCRSQTSLRSPPPTIQALPVNDSPGTHTIY